MAKYLKSRSYCGKELLAAKKAHIMFSGKDFAYLSQEKEVLNQFRQAI
ncbi:MAG: hypothetical protein MRQ13_03930 [Candidatus Midichloria sp.]|nr:hypothetical protein [Candidatus Midichloria sp.]